MDVTESHNFGRTAGTSPEIRISKVYEAISTKKPGTINVYKSPTEKKIDGPLGGLKKQYD